MAALIFALGATAMLLQVLTNSMGAKLLAEDVAQLRAIGDVQSNLATSHLWMEEYVTGDPGSRAEIWSGLAASRALVRAMLEGGELRSTHQPIRPVADARLRRELSRFAARIEDFASISASRASGYRRGENVAPGSEADARYDAAFRQLTVDALALRRSVELRVTDNVRRADVLATTVLAVLAALVALALAGFALIERRRSTAEAALHRSELNLAQAQKMDAVGRLAGGLAHDINNYLAAIVAQCELVSRRTATLREPEAAAAVRMRMDGVIDIATRAAGLIKRLLAFSRPHVARAEVVPLDAVIQHMLGMMRQLLGEEVELVTSFAPAGGNVRIDPTHIEQILVNLVVNAREAMPRGGRVTLATRREKVERATTEGAEPGTYAVLEVGDTGPGIAAAVRERIFEPFFTTKSESSNSGLGLATVYALARQNAGFVRVRTSEGVGTIFGVYLPITLERAVHAEVPPERVAAESPIAAARMQRVLLVEDNAQLREPLYAQLEAMGHRVLSAANGDAALECTQRLDFAPDLVVTDIGMPGLSGPDMVRRLVERFGPQRVLFVSGFNEAALGELVTTDVDSRFLQKPFPLQAFARVVDDLLGRGVADPRPEPIARVDA